MIDKVPSKGSSWTRRPSSLKVLLLAGKLLSVLMALPQIYIGVHIYLNVAAILLSDISFESLCRAANPTMVIQDAISSRSERCIIYSISQNMTRLAETCSGTVYDRCEALSIISWVGFMLRPVMLGILLYKYLFRARFVVLQAVDGTKTRLALPHVGLLDFVMYTLQTGDVQNPISLLSAVSLISYLRFTTAYFLGLADSPPWLIILLGLAHCAACAEGILIIGFILIKMHNGVGRHARVLGVLNFDRFALLLAPMSTAWVIGQLGSYGLLTIIHMIVMPMAGPLYLICVLGYPISTVLCAFGNAKTKKSALTLRSNAVAPRRASSDEMTGSFRRVRDTCSFVESILDISAEELLFVFEVEQRRAYLTNYDLFRMIVNSDRRIRWSCNDERSEHIIDRTSPCGVAYVENGDVHVQLNDAALHGSSVIRINFEPAKMRTKSFARMLADRSQTTKSLNKIKLATSSSHDEILIPGLTDFQ